MDMDILTKVRYRTVERTHGTVRYGTVPYVRTGTCPYSQTDWQPGRYVNFASVLFGQMFGHGSNRYFIHTKPEKQMVEIQMVTTELYKRLIKT